MNPEAVRLFAVKKKTEQTIKLISDDMFMTNHRSRGGSAIGRSRLINQFMCLHRFMLPKRVMRLFILNC